MSSVNPAIGPVLVLAAYLLGAIPFGWILGKTAGGRDVRREGSGNIGATNVARSLGWGAGILTLMLDVGKGAVAVWAASRVTGQEAFALAAAIAVVAGHVFPVYLGFKGGKGVATGLGAFLVLDPAAAALAGVVFAGTVWASRRVSAGSIAAAGALPVILLGLGRSPATWGTALFCSVVIIVRHRENIRRLRSGTEPKLGADP
jgi:glycerol-3-phosphate acyltransferase PlsY